MKKERKNRRKKEGKRRSEQREAVTGVW